MLLARLEKSDRKQKSHVKDEEVILVQHENGPFHYHDKNTKIPSLYHAGVYIEGTYTPDYDTANQSGGHQHGMDMGMNMASPAASTNPTGEPENFTRLQNIAVVLDAKKEKSQKASKKPK